jgi:phosphate-selective porin OprO/OprP
MVSFRQMAAGAATLLLAGGGARTARAEAAPEAPQPSASPAGGQRDASLTTQVEVGFQDGFFVQSADGDYRFVFGLVVQTDGRFAADSTTPIVNTFTARKVRPVFAGRVAKYFDFKLVPDFGGGVAVVQDAYFDIRVSPKFRIRTGKDKTPIGYEMLGTDAYLFFPERALASSLVPNRDVGVQLQGDLSVRVFYAAGLFNGVPDGASSTTDLDTNNSKDVAGRVVVQPFRASFASANPLNGLGFQVGGSYGKQSGALPSFKTSVQQTYFSYAGGVLASGVRDRVSPAVFYYYKSFGGYGEYMRSGQDVMSGGAISHVVNHAWEATASFLLTGEEASYGKIRVKRPFDPLTHEWGALQILARVSKLTVDPRAFGAGLAGPGASRAARQATIAANWYPASVVKIYATYEWTVFDGPSAGARPVEHVAIVRTQLAF